MNRREFTKRVVLGLAAAPAWPALASAPMPKRKLGRTGIEVPIIGFGGGSRFLMYKDGDQALAALEEALRLGINYFDSAHDYGRGKSEERIGQVTERRRKEVVLATKIQARTADQARREIELSLKRLRTDHVDVLHIHALKDKADLTAIEAKGGVLEAVYQAREQKLARAIGITCHASPEALKLALERHDFDCTQMALNAGLALMAEGMKATPAGAQSFENLALPVAASKKMGIIAMKVFGQDQLTGTADHQELLQYSLSLPVSLASVGMPKLEHIRANAALARAFTALSKSQRRKISDRISVHKKEAMLRFFADHRDA